MLAQAIIIIITTTVEITEVTEGTETGEIIIEIIIRVIFKDDVKDLRGIFLIAWVSTSTIDTLLQNKNLRTTSDEPWIEVVMLRRP
jgi:hypothetical protein